MSEEKKEFTVKDRRIFSEEHPDINEKEEPTEPESGEAGEQTPDRQAKESASPKEAQTDSTEAKTEEEPQLPEINFSTFLLSLNASALVNLGLIENPATGKTEKMLIMAKQTIDIMGMLEEKTSGNLTTDEGSLLKNILYELRLNYVKQKK
jgi:hypothetical protein